MGKHLCWSFLARKKVAKKWYVADGTWYRFGENRPYSTSGSETLELIDRVEQFQDLLDDIDQETT